VTIEIEAKIKVESLEPTAGKLREAGAEFKCQLVQTDTYFNDAENKLTSSGIGLRLRRQISDETDKVILTCKGPKKKAMFKSRREIEVELSPEGFSSMVELLGMLGFDKILVFEKRRKVWRLDGCDVCLDEIPMLGSFVEVEGPDEHRITGVLNKLQLSGLEHINKGYARLMREKLDESSSDREEIFFDG
jgi:adenylate cyclase class 2